MKKILLGSIILTAFALSITLFELSCKKTANAQTPSYVLPVATTSILGGVIPDGTTITVDATGKISTVVSGNTVKQQGKILFSRPAQTGSGSATYGYLALWTANYDGTNQQKITITLPTGIYVETDPKLSPDQKTIFFYADDPQGDNNGTGFYSCNIDGSNPKLIIPNTGTPGTNAASLVDVVY